MQMISTMCRTSVCNVNRVGCVMLQNTCVKEDVKKVCPNHCEHDSECKKDACGDKKYCSKVVHCQWSLSA